MGRAHPRIGLRLRPRAGAGRGARGEAVDSNLEVARRADLVILCHKPAQLASVAGEIATEAKAVASVLGATPIVALQEAYPDRPVFRMMPNTAVEVRHGVTCYSRAAGVPTELEERVIALFDRIGSVITLPEAQLDAATAISGVGPAYQALLAEAQIDAAVRYGLSAPIAGRLVVETMAGAAALLRKREYDTLAVKREVTSPGGGTARGLAALERAGIRAAFQDAFDALRSWSAR